MKELKELLYGVSIEALYGNPSIKVAGIELDSRKVKNNSLFAAIRGTLKDGHIYINKAIQNGAIVILCEKIPQSRIDKITYVQVSDTSLALGVLSANFYDNPSEKLKIIGITGTNGKTTVAFMLYKTLVKMGIKTGLLSTVSNHINLHETESTHTTLDIVSINKNLFFMVKQGCKYCFMEVSSHGIDQNRISGIKFFGGVFTNITHEHLDYHKSFQEYINVKKKFFDILPKRAFALVNTDDKQGSIMLQNTKARKRSFSLKRDANYRAQILENQLTGLKLKINENELWCRLVGKFNAYNLIAVYGVLNELGFDENEILIKLSATEPVIGRFQTWIKDKKPIGIVDYAHTPNALENVLKAIVDIKQSHQKIFTVIGCGGNRDRKKRPMMAQIASEYSDYTILTSDNPRDENPERIIKEMKKGIKKSNTNVYCFVSREEAIQRACIMVSDDDILLVAGKGHETHQIIGDKKFPFDDYLIMSKNLNKK